jgi:hypothetical protein
MSRTDNDVPKRAHPNNDTAEPSLANPLTEKLLPILAKSKIEIELVNLPTP